MWFAFIIQANSDNRFRYSISHSLRCNIILLNIPFFYFFSFFGELHQIAPMKLRDRNGNTKKMFSIVTKQTNWKMSHPFYGLICKFCHLFIRFKSFILSLSLAMCIRINVWKVFRTILHEDEKNYIRTTSLSSASFILLYHA